VAGRSKALWLMEMVSALVVGVTGGAGRGGNPEGDERPGLSREDLTVIAAHLSNAPFRTPSWNPDQSPGVSDQDRRAAEDSAGRSG
jgi:hypothetical protein